MNRITDSEDTDIKKYLSSGAAGLFALQILSIPLTFFIKWLITRYIGADDYDIYVYIISWLTLLAGIGVMGFNKLSIREQARLRTEEQHARSKGLYRFSFLWVSLFSSSLAMAFYWLLGVLPSSFYITYFKSISQPQHLQWMRYALIGIPVLALTYLTQGTLIGGRFTVVGQIPERLVRPIVLILSILVLYAYFGDLTLPHILMAFVVALCAGLFASIFYINKRYKEQWTISTDQDKASSWTRQAASLFALNVFVLFNSQIDILLLGSLSDGTGRYEISLRFAEILKMPLMIVNLLIAPLISRFHTQNDYPRLERLLIKCARFTFALAFIPAVLLIIYGDHLLGIFGSEFPIAHSALALLVIGQLVNIACGSVGNVLVMTANERYVMVTQVLATILNVCLSVYLIPKHGFIGTAIAVSLTTVLWNITNAIIIRWKLGINTTIFGKLF